MRAAIKQVLQSKPASKLIAKGQSLFHCAYLITAAIGALHEYSPHAAKGLLFLFIVGVVAGAQNELE